MMVALALAAMALSAAARQPADARDVIVTTGEGMVQRAPDRAVVNITTETRAKSPRDAQRPNLDAMTVVRQRRSQFVIATHSPILMAYPHATIYHLSERGITSIAYEDTEHYQITRDFLTDREFRRSLLCRNEVRLERAVDPLRLRALHVATSLKPEGPVDLRSDAPRRLSATGKGGRVQSVSVDGRELACDLLVASGGRQPAYSLLAQAGARIEYDPKRGIFVPTAP